MKAKRLLAIVLTLCMLLGTMAFSALAEETNTTISSLDEFVEFRDAVNGGNSYAGQTVTLAADIDLSTIADWTPIGNGKRDGSGYTGNSFSGIFDGGNKTISNLTISSGGSTAAIGLFGVVNGGTVKNLTLTNVNINASSNKNAGAAIGLMVGGATADSITVSGAVSAADGVGGVIGRMTISGTVSNCVNSANVSGAAAGGIVGKAYYTAAGAEMNISNCTNSGTITGTATGGAGGIVGFSTTNVSGCTNSGTITSSADSVNLGGIVGWQQMYGEISGNTNNGSVTSDYAVTTAGGIVGWANYQYKTDGTAAEYPVYEVISVTGNTNNASVTAAQSSLGSGGIVGGVYNAVTVTGNTNYAGTITGSSFAAGILGNYQNNDANGYNGDAKTLTVTDNTTYTKIENITANCTNVVCYDNVFYSTNDYTATNTVITETPVAEVNGVKYTSAAEALLAAAETGAAEVKILSSVKELLTTDLEVIIKSDLTITADSAVTVDFYNNGTNYDLVLGGTNGETLTIAENVTLTVSDRIIWIGYYGNNVDVIVDGSLIGGYQLWFGGDVTVSETGTIGSKGEALVGRRDAKLTVNGGSLEANYFSLISGTVELNNATATTGPLWLSSNAEGAGEIILNNSNLTSTGNLKMSGGASVTVTGGSALNVTSGEYGDSVIGEGCTLTIDTSSSVTTNAITGTGAINIDASDFDGATAPVLNTAGMSGFTGNVSVVNSSNADCEINEDGTITIIEVPALADYVVLPDGMDASNYDTLFGDNTVTDGVNYYANIIDALNGIHLKETRVLYCKPGANVGTMTHGHVCDSLTVYGNGAKLEAAGEQDFELDTYKQAKNNEACNGVTADITLKVMYLDGCGAWGQRTTANTLNIIFENCKDMNRVYINGTSGTTNITLTNCSFLGSVENRCTLYSNSNGTITVDNCEFANIYAPVNLNHKIAGTQTIAINNTTFDKCGYGDYDYAAPVRVLSSVEGAESVLTVNGCTFTNTVANKQGQTADVLLDYGVGTATLTISETAAKVTVETEENVGADTDVAAEETKAFTNVAAPVAKIGETGYASLAEALAAAQAMTGDVTVEIYDKVTLNQNLAGSWSSIKFVGKAEAAEIYLEVEGYITATGKAVAFEDLKLSKSAGGYITNAGFMNVAFGVYDVNSVSYTNCTFLNGAYASSGTNTFTNCTFYKSYDKYGLWAYGNVDTVVDGCTFADYRGIKMYAEGAAKTVDLTVKNTNFAAVYDKPAIVLTYGESVTLENNTYSSTGVFELDKDGAPNGTPVTSDVSVTCVNDDGVCGVLVDGKIYTTVAQAAAVATEGSTVTLLHNSAETVEFAEGVILDRNGYTADGVTVKEATPVGDIGRVYIDDDYYESGKSAIFGEVKITATESLVVKLYSGETLVGTASLVDTNKVLLCGESRTVSWHIRANEEDNDPWWDTEWIVPLNVKALPDKAELWVDGVKVDEGNVELNGADSGRPVCAAVTDADGNVQSFVSGTGWTYTSANYDEAMKNAIANGGYITLLRDINLNNTIKVSGATLTLDGNGHTISGNGGLWLLSGNYDIKNVVFDTITTTGYGVLEFTYAQANVTGCTFTNNNAPSCVAVDTNAAGNGNSVVTVDGCTFTANTCSTSVINSAEGTTNIKNSAITGNTAGIAVIYNSANLTATGNELGGNTLTGTNANKAAILTGPWVAGNYNVNITENAFKDSGVAVYVEDWSEEYNAVSANVLSGNYWNGSEPVAGTNYVAEEGANVELKNYYTTYESGALGNLVTLAVPVAKIGETKYESLQAAFKAAKSGDTIELLDDVADAGQVTLKAGVTFNGNGHTLSGNTSIINQTKTEGKFVIQNVIFKEISNGKGTLSAIYIERYPENSEFIVDGCTFDGVEWDALAITLHGYGDTTESVTNPAIITLTNNVFMDSDESTTTKRYIHYQPTYNPESTTTYTKNPLPITFTMTGNKIYDDGVETAVGIWYADADSTHAISGNYIENLDKVAVMVYSDKAENAMKTILPLKDESLENDITYAAMIPSGNAAKFYATLAEALAVVTDGATVELLSDITIDEARDCRYNGAKITASNVTIDGNEHTLKLNGAVEDKNWNTVFRFEGDNATVKNLTIDTTNATSIQRGISSKYSITVDNCTIIGNGTSTKRAVIFGEGAGTAISDVTATITNSNFTNWSYGVSDNQSGKDAKSVSITGSVFTNASVLASASDTVTFTGNTVESGYVNISSYSTPNVLNVEAKDNTLTENTEAKYNKIKAGGTIDAQNGFVIVPMGEFDHSGQVKVSGTYGEDSYREAYAITVQNIKGSEMYVELWSGETKLSTTTLRETDRDDNTAITLGNRITVNVVVKGRLSGSWDTEWHVAPTVGNVPDAVKVYVNGELVDEISGGAFYTEAEKSKYLALTGVYKAASITDGETTTYYATLADAIAAAVAGDTITVIADAADEAVSVNKNVTIVSDASNKATLNNVIFTVENGAALSLDGFEIRGLSYIYAKTPDSISVTNCDINVTTVEVSGTNCPPGFILFSSNNGGSVEFTFTNNTLLAAPDATEDWYKYSHGIAGWNSIEKATITGNTFGSETAPLGAAAVKLMNFVEGAEVTVSGNTIYVNSQDSTWGPNAFQLYQNNSRGNNYTATINDNDFYVDDATAAIGINTNAMGKPVEYAGGAHVAIGSDNTVNGEAISMSDVLVFGNGISDLAYTRGYVGLGIEYNADGKIIGGTFSEYSLGLEAAIADGYEAKANADGTYGVVEKAQISGVIAGSAIKDHTGDSYIFSEISGLNATESVVVKLFDAEGTLLATTTLQKPEYFVIDSLTVKFCIADTSSSWTTVWEEGKCHEDYVPATMTLYVDGTEMNSTKVNIWTPGEQPINWGDVNGVEKAAETATPFKDDLIFIGNVTKYIENGETYYPIYVATSVDSLDYKAVGFKFTFTRVEDGETKVSNHTSVTTKVYDSITAKNEEFTPKNGKYLFAEKLYFPSSAFNNDNTTITIEPYALDLETGEEIPGWKFEMTNEVYKASLGVDMFKEAN